LRSFVGSTLVSDQRRLNIPNWELGFGTRANRASELSSAGKPVGFGTPALGGRACRLRWVAREHLEAGGGAQRAKPAAPLRQNVYCKVTEMAQNL